MDNQVYLNNELYKAVIADEFNLEQIEDLLKQGAQPLGYLDDDKDDCVFCRMLCDASDHMSEQGLEDYNVARERLSKIVELFLKYDMLNHLFYDAEEQEEYLPLWDMQFCCCKDAAIALRMILDAGYTGESVDDFVEHFFVDAEHVDPFDLKDTLYVYHLEWGIRMLMLIASYPEILEKDEYIRRCIHLDSNDKKLLDTFRDIEKYTYCFEYNNDMCEENPALGFVYIKENDKVVWTLDI
jgi:hypothetical protein